LSQIKLRRTADEIGKRGQTAKPGAASANTLRHSVITDLIRARLPILTVAQLAGTSVAMIEKHHGHRLRDDAEEALAALAL
jgi:hypothetical protein